MSDKTVHTDEGARPQGAYLVECPRCGKCADCSDEAHGYRVVCPQCALVKDVLHSDLGHGVQLWLQGDFRGRTLFAYNQAHLQDIEDYVRATHRVQLRPASKSWINRLPQWVKDATNREDLLRLIAKMRSRV